MKGQVMGAARPLGVALLGLGKYATERLGPGLQLTRHCRLRGIVTGTPSKVAAWQGRHDVPDKNVYSYDTFPQIAHNADIDVVYVVTPNHTHLQFAIAAARAKKHVWLEKPMALNVQECQAIIDACAENGVTLSIGYRMRHEPNTQTVMGYAKSRPFGAILQLDIQAGFAGFGAQDSGQWRLKKAQGGGALYDMGVYCINAARYATAEEPVLVKSAQKWTNRADLFREVDEWTEFDLEFTSGAVAHCRTSFGEELNHLRVLCESGGYLLAPMQKDQVRGETSDGRLLNETLEHQQAKQMDDDALAILEGRKLLAPGEEGLRDVRVIEAVQEAIRTGKPVNL